MEGKSSVGTVGMVLNVDGDGSIVGDGSGSPIFCSAVQIAHDMYCSQQRVRMCDLPS